MTEEITRITFSKAHELRNALDTMIEDAFQLGSDRTTVNMRPGMVVLFQDTLTDGSKVFSIAIAQVES